MDTFRIDVKDKKTRAVITIMNNNFRVSPSRILVVGCGNGHEAGILAREFRAEVVGIDIGEQYDFDHITSAPATLKQMDARKMEFEDGSFDFVFSFHALEHIPGPNIALAEMTRVLKPGCHYIIGTPNKSRLIGYFGAPASLKNKIKWNLNDLSMRLSGRWHNEKGAHAGFTSKELSEMCRSAFGEAKDMTAEYYMQLYSSKAPAVSALAAVGVGSTIFPCVYVGGRKRKRGILVDGPDRGGE